MKQRRPVARILGRIRRKKYTTIVVLLMIALSTVPLLGLGVFSFAVARNIIESNHRALVTSNLATANEVMNLVFETATSMARIILSDADLQRELRASNLDRDSLYFGPSRTQVFRGVLSRFFRESQDVHAIYLFDTWGRFYYQSKNEAYSGVYETPRRRNLMETEWYRNAEASNGREVFVGYDVMDPSGGATTFSCAKLLRSLDTWETIGLLVIVYESGSISSTFHNAGDRGAYLVVDDRQDGEPHVVLTSGHPETISLFPEQMPTDYRDALSDMGLEISSYRNWTSGWNALHVIPRSALLGGVMVLRGATTTSTLVMIVVATMIGLMVFKHVNRPLATLERIIDDVARGERRISEEFGDDEIGMIGKQFKRMVEDNLDLHEKVIRANMQKREAQFRALQAQINPHFLFNTLDTVYWLAKMKRLDDVAAISVSLSEIFRHVLNDGHELTTVKEEIHHVVNYLEIQRIRFRDRLTYETEVEPEIMQEPFIKLLLQPFVENAIIHGIEPLMGPGRVTLRGFRQQDTLCFEIEDNGVGMPSSQVRSKGMGIRNVENRIRLFYGDEGRVDITGGESGGTRVTVRIPFSTPEASRPTAL